MDARSKLVFTRRRSTAVARFVACAPSTQHLQWLSAVFHVFKGLFCTVCLYIKTLLLTDVVQNEVDVGFDVEFLRHPAKVMQTDDNKGLL